MSIVYLFESIYVYPDWLFSYEQRLIAAYDFSVVFVPEIRS